MGIVHDGEQAVGELLSGMFKGFPDFTVEIIKTYHSDNAVILEIRLNGTHLGDWSGLKPTGRMTNIPVACIFDFDEVRLICEKVYFDMATLMNQLSTASNK
jgi:predicted ester cyclase